MSGVGVKMRANGSFAVLNKLIKEAMMPKETN
jgi:hypothetical protein